MSFSPVVPFTGYTGWSFLKRTMERQLASLDANPAHMRDEVYFREKIAKVTTAEDLVNDRRLLRITLTAFGLEADVDARAFIRKILTDGVDDSSALSNRLADKRYRNLAQTLGLGKGQLSQLSTPGFADAILSGYKTKTFETAVGMQNDALRLALNAERELEVLSATSVSEDTKWFTIMGNKPLRAVFERAFGLPSSFGQLDIDQQLKTFKARAQNLFGSSSISQFKDEEALQKLVRIYLARDQIAQGGAGTSPMQTALQLLSR